MDKAALMELLEKMRSGSFSGNTDNDPSWIAHREAEKLDDAGLLPMLRELIEANSSKAGNEIRENAYFVMGSLLKNNMEPSYCQFLIDSLRKESDKYVISSMLDSVKCLHIPRAVNIEPMIECSRNDKWQIRHSAINALWASHSEPSREAARYWVRQTDEKTYKYELIFAQASLGYIGEPQDVELLEKHVHSRIRDVRDSAQYAINNIKTRWHVDVAIQDRPPDIEAIITFNTSRKTAASDGYRPPHMLAPGVLTTGVQHYHGESSVAPGESVHGTITFLSPECAPHSLWIGQETPFQEGDRIVGKAEVTEIMNPLLLKENEPRI